jgi:hypothetical protein
LTPVTIAQTFSRSCVDRATSGAFSGPFSGASHACASLIADDIRCVSVRRAIIAVMAAVIMLGTLFGLILLIFGLVLHNDPEARGTRTKDR